MVDFTAFRRRWRLAEIPCELAWFSYHQRPSLTPAPLPSGRGVLFTPASCPSRRSRSRYRSGLAEIVVEQHLVMRLARRDHREAVLRPCRRGSRRSPGRSTSIISQDRRVEIARLVAADADAAIGLGELHEVGQRLRNSSPNSARHAAAPATGAPCPYTRC